MLTPSSSLDSSLNVALRFFPRLLGVAIFQEVLGGESESVLTNTVPRSFAVVSKENLDSSARIHEPAIEEDKTLDFKSDKAASSCAFNLRQ